MKRSYVQDKKHVCAFCGYPGAVHTGGYRKPNGEQGEEWFCDEKHFDFWLKWQAALSQIKAQTHLSKFTSEEVRQAPA